MAKPPTKEPQLHSWTVYYLKGALPKLVGVVRDQPDAEWAIKAAIEKYKVPPNERRRLTAQRRD